MQWTTIARQWPALVTRIERRWPETRAADLRRIGPDRARFAAYLAHAHDLTPSEASEEIALWTDGQAAPPLGRSAR